MRWARHIVRISSERTTLKIFNATPSNIRLVVDDNKRWKDCVDEDIAILEMKINCWEKDRIGKTADKGLGPQSVVIPLLNHNNNINENYNKFK
ncbi:hypothetical protein TNCT_670061 [Trichonephila clavata]|uniref:Uncharacterized protein n=1 Tax=Trichonephila clavata TaxID=2740835 RepID=A0A8X6LT54_TRICU|nr:hypothetical protein TNCT_670061 [Trichonephila clavata]